MTEVAAAAGFGSIRRFNEIFQQLYRRPPRALRRTGVADEFGRHGQARSRSGWATGRPTTGSPSCRSCARAPSRASRWSRAPAMHARSRSATTAVCWSSKPRSQNCLKATVRFPNLKAFAGDYRTRSPCLRSGRRSGGNWRPSQPGPGAGAACRRPAGSAGARRVGRIRTRRARHSRPADHGAGGDRGSPASWLSAYGEKIVDRRCCSIWALTHVFPTPRQLAGVDLAAIGMPKARRLALSSLAAAVVADPLIFGPRRSLEEAVAQLRSLPGIGEWTAQYIAMRELREPDAFPAADIGLMRAMTDGRGVRPSPAALLAHAEQWRPWRAYAALHLWASESSRIPGYRRGAP